MASSQEITQIEAINSALTGLNTTINSTADGFLRIVKNIQDSENSIKNSVQTFELLSKAQKQTTENSSQIDALTKQVTASEQKLRLDLSNSPEFDSWRWVDYQEPPEQVIFFKKGLRQHKN